MTIASIRFSNCTEESAVVIDCQRSGDSDGSRAVFTFEEVEFRNNGGYNGTHLGGAVRIRAHTENSCSTPVLRLMSCRFVKNRAAVGGAVYAEDAEIFVHQSVFRKNEAFFAGGALCAKSHQRTDLSIRKSSFEENKAHGEDRVLNSSKELLGVARSDMLKATGKGGAVFACGVLGVSIRASDFTGNVGCQGGGGVTVMPYRFLSTNETLYVFNVTSSRFTDNRAFCGNQSDALEVTFGMEGFCLGGAIMTESLDEAVVATKLKDSVFLGNLAQAGGALSLQSPNPSRAENRIVSCLFEGNVGLTIGGAATLTRTRTVVTNSTFRNCRSTHGGALYSRRSALIFAHHQSDPSADSVIEGNTAFNSGGILTEFGGAFQQHPRDIDELPTAVPLGSLEMAAVVVRDNTANRGSGGGIWSMNTDEQIVLRGVLIEGNRAVVGGGGVSFLGAQNVTITSSNGRPTIIRNNTAAVGGGILYEAGDTSFYRLRVNICPFRSRRRQAFV